MAQQEARTLPPSPWSTVERRLVGGSEGRWLLCCGITVLALEAAAPTSCSVLNVLRTQEAVTPGWSHPCVPLSAVGLWLVSVC